MRLHGYHVRVNLCLIADVVQSSWHNIQEDQKRFDVLHLVFHLYVEYPTKVSCTENVVENDQVVQDESFFEITAIDITRDQFLDVLDPFYVFEKLLR